VYPAHLVSFLVVIGVAAVVGSPIGVGEWLPNLALVQSWWADADISLGVNSVSWSLSCEAFFYALFPLIAVGFSRVRARTMWMIVGMAYAAYVAAVTWATHQQNPIFPHILYTDPAVRLAEFLIGIAVARTVMAGVRVSAWAFVGAAVIAAVGAVVIPSWPAPNAWLAPAAAVIIAYLAQRDLVAGGTPLLRSGLLHYAGRVSFAFYLVHDWILETSWGYLGHGLTDAAVAFVASCAAAAALHHLVEVPAHRWIVSVSRRRSVATVPDQRREAAVEPQPATAPAGPASP
jgi:peptidoglycan/LPS O-acetylase OafA/YrhL